MTESMLPLVSVAIITYNSAEFVDTAIKSALAQDYPNIEIVISDDASTDNTVEILRYYQDEYPNKIRLLTAQHNVGATANWFKCVSFCMGKYITGLAGDDQMLPQKVSKQVAAMEADADIAICYSDASVFYIPTGKEIYRLSQKSPTRSGDIKTALADSIYYSPTIMFRKNFAPKVNIFPHIRHATDLAYYKEVMILSAPNGKIYYLPEVLFIYNKHQTNLTVTSKNLYKEHIEAIKILQKTYPGYAAYLNASIADFACVGLCKTFIVNLISLEFKNIGYFLLHWLKGSRGNPRILFRSIFWGVKFLLRCTNLG